LICRDDPSLDDTLRSVLGQAEAMPEPAETIVVDSSAGRLDFIRQRHAGRVRWIQFEPPAGAGITIPHQRNAGVQAARGDIIVTTDAGCQPRSGWLANLTAPLQAGEQVAAGAIVSGSAGDGLYEVPVSRMEAARYLHECPTGNLAFRRGVFDALGGFDETFTFGSDVDFSWRINDAGYRIASAPNAVIAHDFGSERRQFRRSYVYGKARARLYRKHRARLRTVLRDDPMVLAYPLFILGLPLTLLFPLYPALLLIPAWRNRSRGAVRVVAHHLTYGAGILAEVIAG